MAKTVKRTLTIPTHHLKSNLANLSDEQVNEIVERLKANRERLLNTNESYKKMIDSVEHLKRESVIPLSSSADRLLSVELYHLLCYVEKNKKARDKQALRLSIQKEEQRCSTVEDQVKK